LDNTQLTARFEVRSVGHATAQCFGLLEVSIGFYSHSRVRLIHIKNGKLNSHSRCEPLVCRDTPYLSVSRLSSLENRMSVVLKFTPETSVANIHIHNSYNAIVTIRDRIEWDFSTYLTRNEKPGSKNARFVYVQAYFEQNYSEQKRRTVLRLLA